MRQTGVLLSVPPFTNRRTLVKGLKFSQPVSSYVKMGTYPTNFTMVNIK